MQFHLVEELLKITLLGSEWVLWLLIVLSLASIAMIVERLSWFARNTRGSSGLRETVAGRLLANDIGGATQAVEAASGVEGRVLSRALPWRTAGADAFAEAVQSELGAERQCLEKGLNFLGTLGNNAPFVGLFGTCIGVIQAFQHLGADPAMGGAAMDKVMYGIAEALIATAVGIFVAIPAVVAYNMVQKRVGEIENRTQSLAQLFTAWLRREHEVTATTASVAAHARATERSAHGAANPVPAE